MPYTEEQYQRAKAQFPKLAPADQERIGAKIDEYEQYKARDPGALKTPEPKLSHEYDVSLAPAVAARAADPYSADENALAADTAHDYSLPTASKLKALARKPEVAGGIGATLKAIALSTVHGGGLAEGALATSHYEPSAAQFMRDQAATLQAAGIRPGTPEFDEKFDEYKDRKWAQAHDAAEADGRPLVRRQFVNHDTLSWGKLGDFLAGSADTAAAFGKGLLAGRTLQASRVIAPIKDRLFGTDSQAEDEAQAERHPYFSMAGELKGAVSGPLAELTKAATIPRLAGSTSMSARLLGAGIAGAAGGEADNASRALATGASDALHGENGIRSAKDQFISHLAGSGLLGAGFGAAGHLVAEGANAYQRGFAGDTPEIGQLRRGGGDTDIYTGIRPGKGVAANVEAAREPLPGEDKARFGGTPTEYAINKVREPLAQAHTDMNAATFDRLGGEKSAYIEAHPETQSPVPVRATSQKVVDWVRSKLQPGEAAGYLPGMQLKTQQVAPGGDVTEAAKLAQQVFKPRLVTATEAKAAAQNNGGFVVDVDQAKKLGFHVGGLDSEGVPPGAPAIETAPANETVSVPKILPKFPKDTHAGDVAPDVTPQEAAAIQRYTWGKRQPGDADLVNNYLERAPVTPLPHVYRGIAMKPEQAHEMMASGSFSTGDTPASVSSDPTVARSFAARNRNAGDVGITLKLEGASARNITPLAHEQVGGPEKELLLPAGKRYEIISKHPDPANPGDWIVVAKEAAPEASAGSTAENVFGMKAEKPSASPVDRLKPRLGRSFKTPVGEPGSDWFDKQKAAETVALHSGDYEVNDPFAAQRSKAPASPTADTPTTPGGAPSVATPSVRPTTPPVELRAKPSPAATQAQAAGLPTSHFKVVLEPQEYNASKFEDILGDIDRKAGYAKASGNPDPKWDEIAQAIREDRKQFGPGWTDLIGKHHVELNKLEQRSVHAGFAEDKAHPEMGANAQIRLQNKLRGFPDRENVDSQDALREIAAAAPPGVQKDLEVLGATNAFQSLKGSAKLRTTGTLGMGGMTERLAGVGGFLKPRADALARDLSAGPTGEPTITPRLHAYLNQVSPSGAKWLPGAPRMGGGALGLKAAVAYDALTPAQQKLLQGLLEKLPGLKKSEGVTP